MIKKSRIFAVSVIAVLTVVSAHATIVSQENVVGGNNVSVTVPESGQNAGMVVIDVADATKTKKGVMLLAEGLTDDAEDNTTAENVTNKVTATTGNDLTQTYTSATLYPSMKSAAAMINIGLSDKVDKKVAGDASKVMVRNNAGDYKPALGDDVEITTDPTTKAATLAVKHATKADQDGDGNVIKSTYQTQIPVGTAGNVVTYSGTKGSFGSVAVDATPTSGSNNLVKSGGVYTELDKKVTANTAIAGATKTKITYDAKGLVTAGDNLAVSDIPENLVVAATNGNVTVTRDSTANSATLGQYSISVGDATTTAKGVVKVGSNIGVSNGTISVADATASTKGVMLLAEGDDGDTTAENVSNKITATTGDDLTSTFTSTTLYPSMKSAAAMVNFKLLDKIDKKVVGDASKVMVRNSDGDYKPALGTDVVITTDSTSKAATLTVDHSTKADKIPFVSGNSTTYASIWIE